LAVGEAGFAELAVGLVAGEHEQEVERLLPRKAGAEIVGAVEVVDESVVFVAAVAALAIDEYLGGRVDGCGAVELAEDRVFGRPEADGEGDRLGESGVGIGELDGVSQLEECGVLVEGLADGVDELEPGAEVLVERRAGDAGSVCDFFDGGGMEASLRKQPVGG
jgi:hypothetical protein